MLYERCTSVHQDEHLDYVQLSGDVHESEKPYHHENPLECSFIGWNSELFRVYEKKISCRKGRCYAQTPIDLRNPGVVTFRRTDSDYEDLSEKEDESS